MRRWAPAAILVVLAALFLIASRGAYKGYFSADELDNIWWTGNVQWDTFARGIVSPLFAKQNFRPAGHFYFWIMGRTAGLDFRPYIAVLHALHLANMCLVWFLLRRYGMPAAASAAGVLFFGFHMAVFDAYWKPMYIFDVLSTAFCLLALLAWQRRVWVLSLLSFWLAYKAKEPAIMLPLVLLAEEHFFGEKRYRRLIPFFAVSLNFGLQGIFLNPNVDNEYTLRLSLAGLQKTIGFYSSQMLLLPYLGFLLPLALLVVRDRRFRFGLFLMAVLLVPMLLLPGRLFGAYLYLSLTGAAVALSAFAASGRLAAVALFLALWTPANYLHMRHLRRAALAAADDVRAYVEAVGDFARRAPEIHTFVIDGAPESLQRWGVDAALRRLYGKPDIDIVSIQDLKDSASLPEERLALLSWDAATHRLYTVSRAAESKDVSQVVMTRLTPVWQLETGWYEREHQYRWIKPYARARLWRPAEATRFELSVNAGPEHIATVRKVTVEVSLSGVFAGCAEFSKAGIETVSWPLPPGGAGTVRVEFRVSPEFRPPGGDPRLLGMAIVAFGFR